MNRISRRPRFIKHAEQEFICKLRINGCSLYISYISNYCDRILTPIQRNSRKHK